MSEKLSQRQEEVSSKPYLEESQDGLCHDVKIKKNENKVDRINTKGFSK